MNGSTVSAFSYLVGTLIDLYVAAVLLRLLLQWVRADFYNPLCQFLVKVTNPVLGLCDVSFLRSGALTPPQWC